MPQNFEEQVMGGICAFVVGDALGVPVEFKSRSTLTANPVTDMREYGTYQQEKGTWSDDSSMTLCTIASLTHGLDYDDMMQQFLRWLEDGYMSAHNDLFDIGVSTRSALLRFDRGTPALQSGGTESHENGNGSLMRILPAAFYLYRTMGNKFSSKPAAYEIIHNFSRLTHAHQISQIACGIYCAIACELLNGATIPEAIKNGTATAKKFYHSHIEYLEYYKLFSRIHSDKFKNADVSTIKSSGYVLSTLEASLWCLLTTDNLKDCLLKAVNLGDDTDTIAAIAGGLAGIYYGKEAIPQEWLAVIPKLDMIIQMCSDFCSSLQA